MARRDQVLSLFGASPAQVLQRIREENQALMAQQRSPQATVGFGIGSELMRAFGPEDPRVAEARRRQAIGQGIEAPMGTADYFTEVAKRFKAQGMMDSALAATQQAQVLRQAELQKAQAQRAQNAAVEFVSRFDPALGKLVAANPDAAAKAIETVNKRLETKVVDKSLLALNPKTKKYEAVYTAPAKPGDSFKILTAKEVKDRGLPANIPFQINTTTNKVSAMANIPTQSEASVPTGYRAVYGTDTNGNRIIASIEPIPGSPQAKALLDERERVRRGYAAKDRVFSVIVDQISDARKLLNDPDAWVSGKEAATILGLGEITGGWASAGTAVQSLNNRYDTIRSNVAFDKLQAIREAAKTGGGLGQVSNYEIGLLIAAISKLDATSKKEDQLDALSDIELQFGKTAAAVANELTDQKMAEYGFTPEQIATYSAYRTAELQPDGTMKPLPQAPEVETFNYDALPDNVKDVWDDMTDDNKRLFGWTP